VRLSPLNPGPTIPHAESRSPRHGKFGFTLIEVLVACAVLALLLVLMLSITDQVQKTYRQTLGKAEQFREARMAFEAITRRLSQATLNTYWDYDSPTSPTRYLRQSELRFRCGWASVLLPSGIISTTHAVFFQAPFGFTANSAAYGGMESMLNTWGYFIEFGSDAALRPQVVNDAGVPVKNRFRLYEMMEPSENLSVYSYTSGNASYNALTWFQDPLGRANRSSRVLAENIIALIFLPKDPANTALTADFQYDSSPDGSISPQAFSVHQLPPYIQVTMVVIDEASARRLDSGATAPDLGLATLFQLTANYQADIDQLQANLLQTNFSNNGTTYSPSVKLPGGLKYRIFTSNVSILGAKWNRN